MLFCTTSILNTFTISNIYLYSVQAYRLKDSWDKYTHHNDLKYNEDNDDNCDCECECECGEIIISSFSSSYSSTGSNIASASSSSSSTGNSLYSSSSSSTGSINTCIVVSLSFYIQTTTNP